MIYEVTDVDPNTTSDTFDHRKIEADDSDEAAEQFLEDDFAYDSTDEAYRKISNGVNVWVREINTEKWKKFKVFGEAIVHFWSYEDDVDE